MTKVHSTLFSIGQMVRHRDDVFRGVVMDVDGAYDGPAAETGGIEADQPFYRVYALGEEGGFVAYVAEVALVGDEDRLTPANERRWFTIDGQGHHAPLDERLH